MRLDEKHKRCVELFIRGTPRDQIAEELGVSRSTVFAWMKDPLVQVYHDKLLMEIEAARRMRLVPTFLTGVKAVELALNLAIEQMQSPDGAEKVKAPGLATLVNALKIIHNMERTDSGHPSSISETQHTVEPGAPRKRTKFEVLMDEVVVEGELMIVPQIELEPKS
jgi:hypothetical protein